MHRNNPLSHPMLFFSVLTDNQWITTVVSASTHTGGWITRAHTFSFLPSTHSITPNGGKCRINIYFPIISLTNAASIFSSGAGELKGTESLSLPSSGGSVRAGWYPLTSALSLVGRGAPEYRAPQVMLHMACSLLRRIKCQLWNHLKDQRSVFLIRPEFWESPPPPKLCCVLDVARWKLWTKRSAAI